MALIYLLLFASPQLLVFLYLRERLPLSARRWLAVVFTVFNIPWVIVAVRMFSGSLWGISRIPYIAASLGGAESLIEQPAIMSFYELTTEERLEIGIKDNLIRYAVGIEDADDLIADVAQALDRAFAGA